MIHFDYRLRSYGWAVAVVRDEHAEVAVRASYLSDALLDLLDAVRLAFTAENAECVWEEEPGQFCWKLRRVGFRCTVEVFCNNEEQATFSGEDDLLHFSSEVQDATQRLLDEWGKDGYLKQWGHPFPQQAHRRLKEAIDTEQRLQTGFR